MVGDSTLPPESWVVVRPPVKRRRNTLLLMTVVGISTISLLAFPILLRALIASQLSTPFTLRPRDLAFPLCVSAFVSLAAMGVGFLDRHSDRALTYDSARDEVVLAEHCCGRTIGQRRYAQVDVE